MALLGILWAVGASERLVIMALYLQPVLGYDPLRAELSMLTPARRESPQVS
jgi:hypothetical protein